MFPRAKAIFLFAVFGSSVAVDALACDQVVLSFLKDGRRQNLVFDLESFVSIEPAGQVSESVLCTAPLGTPTDIRKTLIELPIDQAHNQLQSQAAALYFRPAAKAVLADMTTLLRALDVSATPDEAESLLRDPEKLKTLLPRVEKLSNLDRSTAAALLRIERGWTNLDAHTKSVTATAASQLAVLATMAPEPDPAPAANH